MVKTNVIHVISKFDIGGAEKVAVNISKSKNELFQYHIIEIIKGDSVFTQEMLKEINANGVLFYRSKIKSTKLAVLLFPFWFYSIYKKIKPNVIHSHTEVPDLALYYFCKLFNPRVKIVRTIHNSQLWTFWNFIGIQVERFFNKRKSNVAISLATKFNFEKKYNQKSIPIIYNGVELPKKKEFEFIKTNSINILFAGRFEYQKGIDELIKVVNSLNNLSSYFFHIVGEGKFEEEIKLKLKGCNNYKIYPKIYNLSNYLSSFDYLFMPSNFEGLALLPIEASLSGLLVVINDAPGLSETLPKDWPLKVRNNSVKQFLKIFNNTLPSINKKELQIKAFDFSMNNFYIELMQKKYEEMYTKKSELE